MTSQGNGTSCAYAGTASGGAVSMTLSSCQASRVPGVRCAGGAVRDLQLVGGTLTANVNAAVGMGSGTDVSTWNVFAPGGSTPVGTLTLTANFAWTFLGVPFFGLPHVYGHGFSRLRGRHDIHSGGSEPVLREMRVVLSLTCLSPAA